MTRVQSGVAFRNRSANMGKGFLLAARGDHDSSNYDWHVLCVLTSFVSLRSSSSPRPTILPQQTTPRHHRTEMSETAPFVADHVVYRKRSLKEFEPIALQKTSQQSGGRLTEPFFLFALKNRTTFSSEQTNFLSNEILEHSEPCLKMKRHIFVYRTPITKC